MLNVKIRNDLDFQTRFAECRDFFYNELNCIKTNFQTLRAVKRDAIELIEKNKFELRQKYDPTKFFKVQMKAGSFQENRVSVKKLRENILEMDQ